jgi:predicted trehalose synthase
VPVVRTGITSLAQSSRGAPATDRRLEELGEDFRGAAQAVVKSQEEVVSIFRQIVDRAVSRERIRCHGNLHLGQVLHVDDDVILIDFEGEPGRPLYERRLKRSPLQDVAAMVDRFTTRRMRPSKSAACANPDSLMPWLRHWQRRIAALFVATYIDAIPATAPVSANVVDAQILRSAHARGWGYCQCCAGQLNSASTNSLSTAEAPSMTTALFVLLIEPVRVYGTQLGRR